uniref:VWFA domain-containing protein n=1 Tax=Amphora coffeiformis TaxID=265554 RepID=A0A7S3L3X5_9STRA
MMQHLFTTTFILSLGTLSLVQAQSQPTQGQSASPVDVVFIIDESGSLDDEQQQVLERTQAIFDKLNTRTGGIFRAAVVGFGGSSYSRGRLVTPLTKDPSKFQVGLQSLETDGSTEAGFAAVSTVATNQLQHGGRVDGGSSPVFPSQQGFCSILFTDEDSNGDPAAYDTVEEVASILHSTGNSTFFGIVPRMELLNSNGDTYGKLAAATGGTVMDINEFISDDVAADVMIDTILDQCVTTTYTKAGCLVTGDYDFEDVSLPFSFQMTGQATCSDGKLPIRTLWYSNAPEVSFSNLAMATASASGNYTVCHQVTCLDATFSSNAERESTCCTEVSVTGAKVPGRLVSLQASANQIGGPVQSARRRLRFSNKAVAAPSGGQRAIVSYGGPDDHIGDVAMYPGYVVGFTVVLTEPVTEGEVLFCLKINGKALTSNGSLSFTISDDNSKVLHLPQPVPILAGDRIEIGIRESRFAGDLGTGSVATPLAPAYNTAGILIMMEQ